MCIRPWISSDIESAAKKVGLAVLKLKAIRAFVSIFAGFSMCFRTCMRVYVRVHVCCMAFHCRSFKTLPQVLQAIAVYIRTIDTCSAGVSMYIPVYTLVT